MNYRNNVIMLAFCMGFITATFLPFKSITFNLAIQGYNTQVEDREDQKEQQKQQKQQINPDQDQDTRLVGIEKPDRPFVPSHSEFFENRPYKYEHDEPLTTRPESNIDVDNLVEAVRNNHRFIAQELVCLSLNVYHEARSSTQKDQIGTAHVALNRMQDQDYPDTVCGVIWQTKCTSQGKCAAQFSWTNDGKSDIPEEIDAWKKAQRLAYLAYTNNIQDPTGEATHYYAHDLVEPDWSQGHEKLVIASHTYLQADD